MYKEPKKIVIYHCRNLRLFDDGKHKGFMRAHSGVKLVAIPCSGKVETHHLLKTLADGVDGVLVCACAEQACQYLEGSARSSKRADYAREWLEKLGIEPLRIEFVRTPPMDVNALEALLTDFASRLQMSASKPSISESLAG